MTGENEVTTNAIERTDIENPPALREEDPMREQKEQLAADLRTSIDEVFEKHRELLFALMERTPRPAPGTIVDATTFASIIAVLDIYALEISAVDRIVWQPQVSTSVVYGVAEEKKP